MPKNIVICCDGTGNEYRAKGNTNVVKLFRSLSKLDPTQQINYYDPGVGTMSAPGTQTAIGKAVSRLFGLVLGLGMTRNLADAYVFLMKNYQPGDRVFLFGFSRGAYTVRALAGMLHMCGLLEKGSDNLVPYAIKVYSERKVARPKWAHSVLTLPAYIVLWPLLWLLKRMEPDWARAGGFKKIFSRTCDPHFIGVWDTVKSIGWLRRRIVLPYTANHPNLKYGRHAVSLDEKRSQYRTNLWGYENQADDQRDIQQVWFAGVHSDVGGSYDRAGLADITLDWMVDAAEAQGLVIDKNEYGRMDVAPDAKGKLHNPLLPLWWLLGWRRRKVSNRAWIHKSVARRCEQANNEKRPYRPSIPADARFVE